MENQHRQITGYGELTQEEIHKMNEVKFLGEEVGELVERLERVAKAAPQVIDGRWVAIAKTHLQQGFMALTRSIAKPTSF